MNQNPYARRCTECQTPIAKRPKGNPQITCSVFCTKSRTARLKIERAKLDHVERKAFCPACGESKPWWLRFCDPCRDKRRALN